MRHLVERGIHLPTKEELQACTMLMHGSERIALPPALRDRTLSPEEARKLWVAERRFSMGASDAPIVMGTSHYKSEFTLACEKMGLVEADSEETEYQIFGHLMEKIAIERMEMIYSGGLVKDYLGIGIRHNLFPWNVVTPDRYLILQEGLELGLKHITNNPFWIPIEIKNVSEWNRDSWGRFEIPAMYYDQVQDQLEATGRPCSIVLAILGGNRMQEYTVWRDTQRGAQIVSAMDYFWQNCQNGIRPPVDGSESTAKTLGLLHPAGQPSVDREMTPEMARIARDFLRAHARAKKADEIKKLAESKKNLAANMLREQMGATTSAVGEGVKVTWNSQETKVIDAEGVKADEELARAIAVVERLKSRHVSKKEIRVLRVTEPKPKK